MSIVPDAVFTCLRLMAPRHQQATLSQDALGVCGVGSRPVCRGPILPLAYGGHAPGVRGVRLEVSPAGHAALGHTTVERPWCPPSGCSKDSRKWGEAGDMEASVGVWAAPRLCCPVCWWGSSPPSWRGRLLMDLPFPCWRGPPWGKGVEEVGAAVGGAVANLWDSGWKYTQILLLVLDREGRGTGRQDARKREREVWPCRQLCATPAPAQLPRAVAPRCAGVLLSGSGAWQVWELGQGLVAARGGPCAGNRLLEVSQGGGRVAAGSGWAVL